LTLRGFAAIAAVTAAIMVASNLGPKTMVAGFSIFVAASLAWMADGWLDSKASLVAQNALLLLVNLAGIWFGRPAPLSLYLLLRLTIPGGLNGPQRTAAWLRFENLGGLLRRNVLKAECVPAVRNSFGPSHGTKRYTGPLIRIHTEVSHENVRIHTWHCCRPPGRPQGRLKLPQRSHRK
jgi:hypothetical protein